MSAPAFGITGLVAVAVYLAAMLYVGLAARRATKDHSMGEFYLAGRGLGAFVLFATLYATQYSGNSFLGYPGEAYRIGFAWIMSAGFMTAIIVAYLAIAPQLYRASRSHAFVTPGDWLDHRFASPSLTLAANLVMVVAIANYLLAQLMAMGHAVAGLSGGAIPYWVGVVALIAVILIYETLGGMRAVAWTDAVQGGLLMVGLGGVLLAVLPSPGHLAEVTAWVAAAAPEKVAVPDWTLCMTWISTLLLIGLSGSVYPQAIQRIYAARSTRALKRGVSGMAVMPLFTMIPLFLVGILSLRELSGLEGAAADQVMPMMLTRWAGEAPWLYAAALAVTLAVIAAIMSTADSVLLTLSSILAKDFMGKTFLKGAPDATLTRAGKFSSWVVIALLITIAINPRITLWGLTELKMELLMQVWPMFLLGIHWKPLTAPAALAGLAIGLAVSFVLPATGYSRPLGVHDGTIGWAVNLVVCVVVSRLSALRHEHVPVLRRDAAAFPHGT